MHQVGGQYPLHTAVTCLHSSSSVAIVKALLDHGANPNSEEGVPRLKSKENGLSIPRKEEEVGEGERLNARDEAPEVLNKVTFLVGDEDNMTLDHGDELSNSAAQAPIAMSVMAGDNLGSPGYTPLHILCSTEITSTTGIPAATQELVRQKLIPVVLMYQLTSFFDCFVDGNIVIGYGEGPPC